MAHTEGMGHFLIGAQDRFSIDLTPQLQMSKLRLTEADEQMMWKLLSPMAVGGILMEQAQKE